MDEQPGVDPAVENGVLNLVERQDDPLEVGIEQLQRQVRRRQRAGNPDTASLATSPRPAAR